MGRKLPGSRFATPSYKPVGKGAEANPPVLTDGLNSSQSHVGLSGKDSGAAAPDERGLGIENDGGHARQDLFINQTSSPDGSS